jgi:hypothetical protein
MDSGAGDSLKTGATVDRGDRSGLALLEIGAAAVLIGSFFVPWYVISGPGYTTWISAGGYSPAALTTGDLLTPYAPLVALVVTLVGLAFPARGAKVARVDIARQLAEAIWHVLSKNEPFAPAGPAIKLVA